ncbi:MAG: hypothetical protein KOO62_00045 [candidate division Zixibacteria bacterium]|nr:hypothetical protein [candidate division Zixibacteria bacterium]
MIEYMKKQHSIRRYAVCLALAFLILPTVNAPLLAASQSSARSVAMGGAFTSLAAGVDAYRYNPANLGFDGNQRRSLEIVGLGANVSNNSFSLDDYNNYTGAVLTNDDKDYLLDRIPDEGLTISADIEASAVSLSFGSFAFSLSGVGQADVSLGKDIIDLMLNGNTFGDTIDVAGSYSDAVGYVAAGVSYGLPIYTWGSRQLTVGATAKYIRGLGMEEVVEIEGLMATHETGFAGEGHLIARTATGGSGYALDLGAAMQLSDSYTIGVRTKNVLSTISWNSGTEEHGYMFSFDTMTADNMDEDYVVSDDYSNDITGFSTSLPAVMNVGIANTSGKLVWAVDWEQGFRRAAGASKKPRLAAGLEYSGLLSNLPLRTGFATGGSKTTAFSFGAGLNLGGFYIDAAAVTGKSFSASSSNGLNVSVSTGVFF